MKVVRFLKSYRMYQPGETAGFDGALAGQLIAGGFAVDPDAVAVAPAPEPDDEVPILDPRTSAIESAILSLDEDDFTQSGKPDVDAINAAIIGDFERVTASERDAIWAELQGA